MLKYCYHKVLPARKHVTAHVLCKIKYQQNIVKICETAALNLSYVYTLVLTWISSHCYNAYDIYLKGFILYYYGFVCILILLFKNQQYDCKNIRVLLLCPFSLNPTSLLTSSSPMTVFVKNVNVNNGHNFWTIRVHNF